MEVFDENNGCYQLKPPGRDMKKNKKTRSNNGAELETFRFDQITRQGWTGESSLSSSPILASHLHVERGSFLYHLAGVEVERMSH